MVSELRYYVHTIQGVNLHALCMYTYPKARYVPPTIINPAFMENLIPSLGSY